jgi:Uncharacterised nucleotidyltransferase
MTVLLGGAGSTGLVGRILVASLDPDRDAARRNVHRLMSGRVPPVLPVAARWHRVGGFLLDTLRGEPAFADVVAPLQADYEEAVVNELRALADLRRAAALLDRSTSRWLVVKGPVLVDRYYGAAGLRAYTDVDLVVPARAFADVVEALTSAGCAEENKNWTAMESLRAGEVQLRGWHGTPLDVHWALLFRGELRDQFAVDVDSAIERARAVTVAEMSVATFDDVDTLLHLCLHAAMGGGHRLVWMSDIDRCVAVDRPDWDAVVARTRQWQVTVPVGLMLARARRTLGTPVPVPVTRLLIGTRASHAVATLTDTVWPVRRASDRGSPARMLARSARATMPATRRELAGRLRNLGPRHLRELLRPDSKVPRSSMLYRPSDEGTTRSAYLASVASGEESAQPGRSAGSAVSDG